MKTIKQILRQPMKTLLGIFLMTLAASILCLCIGQALAAKATEEKLNRQFSTVGIPKVLEDADGRVAKNSFFLEKHLLTWVEKMAAQRPDIVKHMGWHGILSGYIPELTPYNSTVEHFQTDIHIQVNGSNVYVPSYNTYQASPYNLPYCGAMLVITLEEVSEPTTLWKNFACEQNQLTREDFDSQSAYQDYLNGLEQISKQTGYSVCLTGKVTQVVALQEGYRDIVGRNANLILHIPSLEALEALNLVPGEQYIVYGMDFVDTHMDLVGLMDALDLIPREKMDPFNPELLHILTPEEVEENFGLFVATYAGKMLSEPWFLQLNSIAMTLTGPACVQQYEEIRNDNGYLLNLVEKTQYTLTDANGETLNLSKEEYIQRYQVPTIARLDGSLEDFLNSAEGALWKAAMENTNINSHAFLVIGVDDMDYVADFSLKRSQIVEGRDFTAAELQSGARVCLVQEKLAAENGLQIGDTITLNLYSTDPNLPYQFFREDGVGMINPTASFYFGTTPFTETAEYTVVGFYRCDSWPDLKEDPYAYSANTVFVPKASVKTPMEQCDSIVFNTLILQNGKIEAFHKLAMQAGLAGRFKYNDQGYSTIAANFHNYASLAKQLLVIGAVLYSVLLLLFLMLYPGAQKNNVRAMQSFGASFFHRFGHVMGVSLGIVIPASILGCWIGNLLWDNLVKALQTTAESAVALQIEPGVLTAVAGIQLIFALFTTVCVAIFIAAPRGIARRR